ncbi:hypothetical protein [Pontibacter oryzae]|uniref:Lipocalin-like domain-containing protein n=1 Tax=Pontibacter oryzae TaxID=2304593 RepID=A0A399S050_9BACT|nr:hypothetical protein [Pontibacter oryzae]RIJ36678.1 hypothetical protein D1627_12595 [Pontibacter oryzae]
MKKTHKAVAPLFAVLLTIFFTSCGGEEEVGSENMISGADNKTWVVDEEKDASGQEQDLTDTEEAQNMQFYADGRFAMGGNGMLQTGTWSFDQTAKRITLQFEDEDVTQTFEVLKLDDDEMDLKAPDGTTLELEVKE